MKRTLGLLGLALLAGTTALLLESCGEKRRTEPQPSEPSPNASIMPSPLASELVPSLRNETPTDAGAPVDAAVDAALGPPRTLRDDEPLESDAPLRETLGLRLQSRLRWLDLPPFSKMPEANLEATQRLRDALAFDIALELAALGHLRARFESDAFVIPRGSELRSRIDRLGHVLTWDGASKYTALPPGSLRAALGEHRPDSTPVVTVKPSPAGAGSLLGLSTEKVEVSTPLGRLILEQTSSTNLAGAGSGGVLLCRLLLDLIAADGRSSACARSLVPLRAELFSRGGGHLLFETLHLERDQKLDATGFLVPPEGARFVPNELPAAGGPVVPSNDRLRELRVRPVTRIEKPDPLSPKQGLVLHNRTDVLRYVLLDGVVLARVPARAEVLVDGLLAGKYALVTLDFYGDESTPLRILELPARVALGDEADSGR